MNILFLAKLYVERRSSFRRESGINTIESKIFKQAISKAKRKAHTNFWEVSFLNKGMKLIKVLNLYLYPSAKVCLPANIKFHDSPVVD